MGSEPERLRDLLGDVGGKLGLGLPSEVGQVWTRWADIVGASIAAHAEPTSLRAGVLRVRADSPAWATELGYLVDEIRNRVNKAVATDLVREVRVWIGPRADRPREAPSGPSERAPVTRAKAPSDDPQEAFERAREAWSKAAGGGARRPSSGGAGNKEKPR